MTGTTAFDVAVVGGGSAGVAAALAAARMGARTVLLERSDRLGGNAALAQVHTICGLYPARSPGEPAAAPRHAHAGFPRVFAEGLRGAGAAGDPAWAGRVAVLPTEPTGLSSHALALCAAEENLDCRLGCELRAAELDDTAAALRTSAGDAIAARIAIDASGDGALAALAGAAFEISEPARLQNPSYVFRLSGVEPDALAGTARMQLTHAVARATRTGALPEACESVTFRPALEPGDVYVTLNVPRPGDRPYDPLDDAYRTALEDLARDAAGHLEAFLYRGRPGFGRAKVSGWPRRLGVRETRRISGIAAVSREDVLTGRRRDDEIAVSTWPIELWRDHRRAHFEYGRGPCGIPLGALISRSHPRLGTAGRCISASHEALGALRVIGTALATGEAAGVAAALAADSGASLAAIAPADVRGHIVRLAGNGGSE